MKYRRQTKRKMSLKVKLLLITSLITVTAIVVVSSIFYRELSNQTTYLLQKQALAIAKSATVLIDGNEFERLTRTLDADDEYYKEVLVKLKALNEDLGQGMLYAFTNQDSDTYTYVMDGSGQVEIGYKQQKLDFANEAAMAFENGESYYCEAYYVNTFHKYYLSAFVPIFNSAHQVVGVVEYDYQGSEIKAILNRVSRHIFVAALIVMGFLLIMNYFILKKLFRPIEKLVNLIGIIAKGDLTIKLTPEEDDEIGQINHALNETIHNISSILEEIKKASKKVTIASKSILVSSNDATEVYEELAVSSMKILDTTQKQIDESKKVEQDLDYLQQWGEKLQQKIEINQQEVLLLYEVANRGYNNAIEAEVQISKSENKLIIANQIVHNLDQYIGKIHEMLGSVLDMSEQTTILALKMNYAEGNNKEVPMNVGKDIEKLLNQSHNATNGIHEMINLVEEQIKFVGSELDESASLMKGSLAAISNSKKSLLATMHNSLYDQMKEIHAGMQENITNIARVQVGVQDMEEVYKFIDSSTMSLLAITQEQVATADEFNNMAQLLREQANILDDSISRFIVSND